MERHDENGEYEVAAHFDEFSANTSSAAAEFLERLCEPRQGDDPSQWSDADDKEFAVWKELEDSFRLMPLPAELGVDEQLLQFHQNVDILHASLPFCEEERNWLIGATNARRDFLIPFRRVADWHIHQEQRIMVAGIRKVVQGRELVHRWYDWRRERNEYSGQDALPVARSVLWRLMQMLTPDAPQPEAYAAMLRRKDQPSSMPPTSET